MAGFAYFFLTFLFFWRCNFLKRELNFHVAQGQQHSYKRVLCFTLCLRSITKGLYSAVWQPVCFSPLWLTCLAPVLACAELMWLFLDLWQKLAQAVPTYLQVKCIRCGSGSMCRAPICQLEALLVDLATHGGQAAPIWSWLCDGWGVVMSFQDRWSTFHVWKYNLVQHQKNSEFLWDKGVF